ncbi:MAG: tetratricopeptide repeat protein [Pirellulales bacterium]
MLAIASLAAPHRLASALAGDSFSVGDQVTTSKDRFCIWDASERKSYVYRYACALPVKVERVSNPWLLVSINSKRGWVRMVDFKAADKKTDKKPSWNVSPESSTSSATTSEWLTPPSPLLAYAEGDDSSGGDSKSKTPAAVGPAEIAMPTGPIAVGDAIMPRDRTVAVKYRAKSADDSSRSDGGKARGSRGCRSTPRAPAVKTVATAADILWPVRVRQIKGDWLWIDEPENGHAYGWIRRADVIAFADAPLYYTMQIVAAKQPQETANWYALRALCRRAQRRDADAIRDVTAAIETSPETASYYVLRAELQYESRQCEAALADVDKGLQLDPASSHGHLIKGHINVVIERCDEALLDYGRAIEVTSGSPADRAEAYTARGALYLLEKRDPANAIRDIDRAVELAPTIESLKLRATYRIAQADMEGALEDVRLGISRRPKDHFFRILQMQIYAATGRPLCDLETADMDDELRGWLIFSRLSVALGTGQEQEALKQLEFVDDAAVKAVPVLRCFRAALIGSKGHWTAAEQDMTTYLEIEPDHASAYAFRGAIRAWCHRFAAAEIDYQQAISLAKSPAASAEQYENLGNLHSLIGNVNAALVAYARAIELQPNCSSARLCQAACLIKLHRVADALIELNQTLATLHEPAKVTKKSTPTWNEDVNSLRFDIPIVSKSQSVQRTEAKLRSLRSAANLRLGNYDAARTDYETAVKLSPRSDDALIAKAEFLARCPDEERRDARQAMTAAREACVHCKYKRDEVLSALAAAYAAGGNFKAACFWQELVRDFAPNELVRSEAEDRLACYRQGRIATPAELVARREARETISRPR